MQNKELKTCSSNRPQALTQLRPRARLGCVFPVLLEQAPCAPDELALSQLRLADPPLADSISSCTPLIDRNGRVGTATGVSCVWRSDKEHLQLVPQIWHRPRLLLQESQVRVPSLSLSTRADPPSHSQAWSEHKKVCGENANPFRWPLLSPDETQDVLDNLDYLVINPNAIDVPSLNAYLRREYGVPREKVRVSVPLSTAVTVLFRAVFFSFFYHSPDGSVSHRISSGRCQSRPKEKTSPHFGWISMSNKRSSEPSVRGRCSG